MLRGLNATFLGLMLAMALSLTAAPEQQLDSQAMPGVAGCGGCGEVAEGWWRVPSCCGAVA